jgi:ABC-type multidrug transport system fused ATPase/permease subunit
MWTAITRALGFMSKQERFSYFTLLILRSLVGLVDLLAILGIGFLASSLANNFAAGETRSESIKIANISLPHLDIQSVPILGLAILMLFVAKAGLSIFFTLKSSMLLARIEARAAKVITENSNFRGLERAKEFSRNEILFAVQTGSPALFNALLLSVSTFAAEAFLFAIILITFASLSPLVAVSALVYFGLIGLTIQVFIGRELEKTSAIISENSMQTSEGLLDLGEVFREAFTVNKRQFFIEKIYQAKLISAKNVATQYVLQGSPRHVVETSLIFGISVFIFFQAMAGDLVSAAAVTAVFLTGGLRLTAALIPLQASVLSIKQAVPLAKPALEILSAEQEPAVVNDFPWQALNGESALGAELENVSFTYSHSPTEAISKVSISIKPGQQVALIGPSGGGKTTLVDLMLGLLIPASGTISLGGVDPNLLIRNQPGLLGYVPQKPGMVSGTLLENIALGVHPSLVDNDRINQAVSEAHLAELVESLPSGLNTSIGKSKDDFSGGQLQRIGLARALYNRPKLLIMDEATSALDAESEAEINIALDALRGKTTVILIAHRLNTVQKSDVVFLIESGTVSASGTFPELLAENRTVKKLVSLMSLDS